MSSSPSRNVRLSQPSTATPAIGRSDHCGNWRSISRRAVATSVTRPSSTRAATRLPFLIALAALALLPASAAAKAPVCDPDNIQQALIAAGKLTEEGVRFGEKVDLVRCGEVTADDTIDAVFTVFSGGTAGDTHFGVLRGNADGSPGALALYRRSYKVGIARHNRRSFDVIQPHYAGNDAELLPELVPRAPVHVDRHPLQARQGEEAQDRAATLLQALILAARRSGRLLAGLHRGRVGLAGVLPGLLAQPPLANRGLAVELRHRCLPLRAGRHAPSLR